jgi:hypothetical protein
MLSLAVWLLPQLPGQLVEEHAASATWLLNTSATYGIWGSPFLALGLFDVIRSPLLYLLLALLLPTLAAQLADQLGALYQLHSVQSYPLNMPVQQVGEVIPLSSVRPLFRWRGAIHSTPTTLGTVLRDAIHKDFTEVKEAEVPPSVPPASLVESDLTAPVQSEQRILGIRFPRLQYLRPLLMIGLMLSVVGAWIALAFGWQISTPPLAPGDNFRSANRNLLLHYSVTPTTTLQSALDATLQNESVSLPTGEGVRKQLGPATIEVRPAYPALLVATADGSERLTLPGESKLRSQLGMVFANPGSEESILIPDQGIGIRIVQRTGSDGFVLELYGSDAIQPVYRAELTEGGNLTIPFGLGDTDLFVATMPGLQVDIRHLPGLWLVPLGIVLASIGALAFLRPSSFVLAQSTPWTEQYSIVILQSDHPNIVRDLRSKLEALTHATAIATDHVSRQEEAPPTLSQTNL